MEPLEYDQIFYNEPIFWLEQKWQRKLTDHEKHLAILIYRFTRTLHEVEEIKGIYGKEVKGRIVR